jgi:hypothetical protein
VREDGLVGHLDGVGRHEVGVMAEVVLEVIVVAEAQGDSVLSAAAVVYSEEDSEEVVAVSFEGHNTNWDSTSKVHVNRLSIKKNALKEFNGRANKRLWIGRVGSRLGGVISRWFMS